MRVAATTPGKLVVLGEYAVLTGAPAIVVAVDRRCRAEVGPSEDESCHLGIRAPDPVEMSFPVGAASGVPLVDLVVGADEAGSGCAWRANVDSSDFFDGQLKLGIGSSAAALTSWAAAWSVFSRQNGAAQDAVTLERLIGLHRALQGGSGSGLDVAASLRGGALIYRLEAESAPSIGSVELPNSVGFTAVYSGRSAATGDLVAVFDEWRRSRPVEAAEQLQRLTEIAEEGCAAAGSADAQTFLAALGAYGKRLDALGRSMGAEIVTREHREISRHAEEFGVVYKVSGAGGGDLGVAFSADVEALDAFRGAVGATYRVVDFAIATTGLTIEESDE